MKPELYIPHCCITMQLPTLVNEHGDHGIFYSRGDWGFRKLWKALSSMVSSSDTMQIMTILIVPDIDVFALRYIHKHLSSNWSTAMVLITQTDRTDILQSTMSGLLDRFTYIPSRQEAASGHGLWIRSRSDGTTIMVSGDIDYREDAVDKSFSMFSYSILRKNSEAIYAFQPWRAIIRTTHGGLRGGHPLFSQWF